MSAAIARLRRLAAHLADDGDVDGLWFAAALAQYEAGARHGARLDAILELVPGPGGAPWWEVEARARRDAIIREIATPRPLRGAWRREVGAGGGCARVRPGRRLSALERALLGSPSNSSSSPTH